MAYITKCECRKCGKTKLEDGHTFRGVCAECLATEADQSRRVHLAGLKSLSVEERLERIEAEIYDTQIEKRLSALEVKGHSYS